jgi:uncharacterized RDD family membrane protein YckC
LQCPKCGAELAGGSESCPACGERILRSSGTQTGGSGVGSSPERLVVVYAGFWLRAVAYLLDSLVIGFLAALAIFLPLMERGAIPPDNPWFLYQNQSRQVLAMWLLMFMVTWLYFASFEASAWQATPGKKLLGLRVTDLAGRRITFTRASWRYLGKLIFGSILFFGFLFAAFTPRKQALYDMTAECLVLRNS